MADTYDLHIAVQDANDNIRVYSEYFYSFEQLVYLGTYDLYVALTDANNNLISYRKINIKFYRLAVNSYDIYAVLNDGFGNNRIYYNNVLATTFNQPENPVDPNEFAGIWVIQSNVINTWTIQ